MTDIKILGYSLEEWDDMLDGDKPEQAHKALKYLDGDQEEEMEDLLSDPHKGRRNWKERGFIPRCRNLVKPVVTHSGMLFKDAPPVFSIYNKNSDVINEQATWFLNNELYKTEWDETCITLDETTRLLKTDILLTQWDPINQELVNTVLHRGNSAVLLDEYYRDIIGLVYETSKDEVFCIITKDFIYEVQETEDTYALISQEANPYGIINASPFHDTNKPRCGFWNNPGMDLVNANEMLNLHLTDTEFALKWAKQPTLFTNCMFGGSDEQSFEVQEIWNQKLPRVSASDAKILGGPSQAVILDSAGVDSPFVEYKAPAFDVKSMDDVVNSWVYNVAQDWSVRLQVQGEGRATSGFQLVVEELPNTELRQQRQKMFSNGFKRWYKVVSRVLNTVYGRIVLPEDAELQVDFQHPQLPVEDKQNEDLWTTRITEGRASLVDYFIEVRGMTKDEALAKIQEIQLYKNMLNNPTQA